MPICGGSLPHLHPSSGKSVKLALKHAKKAIKKHPQLSLDEAASLVLYTIEEIPRELSLYYVMNGNLRAKDRKRVRPWRDYIWLLLHALRKLPVETELVLFRGARASPSDLQLDLDEDGFEFTWSGFSSTARTQGVMETFVGQEGMRTMLTLQLTEPIGRKIADFSLFPEEDEVLLPPNICFEVASKFNAGNGLIMVQCRQTETIDGLIDMRGAYGGEKLLPPSSTGGSSPLADAIEEWLPPSSTGGPSPLADDIEEWFKTEIRRRVEAQGHRIRLLSVPTGSTEYNTMRQALKAFFGRERVLCLKGLQRVEATTLSTRFGAYRPPLGGSMDHTRILIHGTSLSMAKDIARDGFCLPTQQDSEGNFYASESAVEVHDDFEFLRFGGGIYCTSMAAKADLFAQAAGDNDEPAIVICAVKLGRMVQLEDDGDEHYTLNATGAHSRGFDAVYCPSDEKDEYVVYDPYAILPMYVATYHTVRPRGIEFFLQQQQELAGNIGSSSMESVRPLAAREAHSNLSTLFAQYADPTIAETSRGLHVFELFSIIGNAAQQGGVNAAGLSFLEDVDSLVVLAKGLVVACELSQWQALRALSNFCLESERRQALMRQPRIFSIIFSALCTLLTSDNEAVVQKATFLACNLSSHHSPPKGAVMAVAWSLQSSLPLSAHMRR